MPSSVFALRRRTMRGVSTMSEWNEVVEDDSEIVSVLKAARYKYERCSFRGFVDVWVDFVDDDGVWG